jgi:hypothetical protein
MDNNLWIFGDSFSAHPEEDCGFNVWPELVGRHFKLTQYINWAQVGVSNDFIFHEFTSRINEMKEGDYVIIQTTAQNRQWFFEDPGLANYMIRDLAKFITADQKKAVDYYIEHLQSDKVDSLRYAQFSLALERISVLANHLRILVLPGFYSIAGVTGTLTDIADSEHQDSSKEGVEAWYRNNKGKDPRYMHLSEKNHAVLAQKVIEFYETGKHIDLTEGFFKHFLGAEQ